ncbi:major facilitator superfamily domain-containing protein [Daldinia caldariorum]|uniref:major facilitator superfamily domain-containing protein n=1 Tax=Daldinia caldariorum TaxID=326644 RepID=UPI002007471A|nr:major facilitator superfamily domain-containing protein [Daldinia caldariorum]KAI1469119.1 major facilitator superfamily domain-containing protein [Daldinia caldariorum]
MEALAVFGLVSNVLQFVDMAYKIISASRPYLSELSYSLTVAHIGARTVFSNIEFSEHAALQLVQKPPGHVLPSILCSLGGFLFGIDTGIIGLGTVMGDFAAYVGNLSPAIYGLIVSSIPIPAAISSLFAGRLADALGRPYEIAIGSLVFGVGAAFEGASVHIAMFIVGRIIEGIGEGLYLSVLVVQLLITVGLVTGYFTCYGTANIQSSSSWRLPFVLLAAYAIALPFAVLIWLPASPVGIDV